MIESHVVNFDLSRKLHELGVKKESQFVWTLPVRNTGNDKEYRVHPFYLNLHYTGKPSYKAYLASELLGMLPEFIYNNITGKNHWLLCGIPFDKTYTIYYEDNVGDVYFKHIEDKNICNAAAKILIYLIENKMVSIEEINK